MASKTKIHYKYWAFGLLCFGLFGVLLPTQGHTYDLSCWSRWSSYIFEHGLGNVYQSGTNYLPVYHYLLAGFAYVQGSTENIVANIYYLKLVYLVFHLVTGYFLLRLLSHDKPTYGDLFGILFYVLNIAVLYNALVWGQVDDILTCFVLLSFFFAYRKKIAWALVFFILALNFKLQGIIFFPLIGLLLLPQIVATFTPRRLLGWVLICLLLQGAILLPFVWTGSVHSVWAVVTESVGKHPVVSMNAYNFWDLCLSGNLMQLPDSTLFCGVSYKRWGLFLFFASSGVALLPMAMHAYHVIFKQKKEPYPLEQYLLVFGLIPILFFFFNTQMHERYSHPALVFVVGYAIHTKTIFPALLLCFAYFLNMEDVLQYMDLHYGTLIFDRRFIAALYLVTIGLLFFYVYRPVSNLSRPFANKHRG